jgi:subtilisin family serine protease
VRQIVRTVTGIGVGAAVLLGGGPVAAAGAPSPTGTPAVAVAPGTTTAPATDPVELADATDSPDRSVLPEAPDPTAAGAERGDAGAPAAAPDRVLVQFAPGVDPGEQDAVLAAEGVATADAGDGTPFVEVTVGDADPADVVAALDADPRVEAVQLDVVRTAQARPADELADLARPYLDLMRLPRAWDVTSGAGQVIAVLDTGVDLDHPDLAGHLVPGYDAVDEDGDPGDDQWHGTAVAGVAAATGGNRQGAAGAAYGAKIMPVKVLDHRGSGYDSDVARGIRWAAEHGADVINLSLGGPGASPVLRAAIADAVAGGAVVLAAAGNSGTQVPEYPAAYAPEVDGLLSVGATDDAGVLTPFSTWGDTVSVAAPGKSLVAPSNGGGYLTASGTSFSTPLVSGVAALLTSRGQDPAQVEQSLVSTARDAGPRGRDPSYGAGVVDAAAALGLGGSLPLEQGPGDGATDDSTPARARALAGTVTAALSPEGDEDWYAVDVRTAGWYTATVTPTGSAQATRPQITVLSAGGEVLATGAAAVEGSPLTLAVPVPATGAVRLGVANVDGSRGDRYTVTFTRSAGAQPLVGTGAHAWVLDTSVTSHSAGVVARPTLTVTLGRALADGAVSAATVRVVDGSTGADVATTLTEDRAAGTLAVTPTTDLAAGRHYQLWVGGLTGTDGAVQATPSRTWFTVAAGGDRFTPVEPRRVLDTRTGTGVRAGVVRPGSPVRLVLGGVTVPADATAVVLNVTAVGPTAKGSLRVYPTPGAGTAAPTASLLNVVAGEDQPNLATVALGRSGDVTFATFSATSHVVADVVGYYRAGGATAFVPLDPERVLDTRAGTGGVPRARVAAGRWVDLQVTGRNGVPADAAAVVLNVTGVGAAARTDLRVYPAPAASEPQTPSTVRSVNLLPGHNEAAMAVVPVGDGGRIRFYSHAAATDIVAELAGYYSATGTDGFVPVTPARVADSRTGAGIVGALTPGRVATFPVRGRASVPAAATAVVVNASAVSPAGRSNIRLFPTNAGDVVPGVSAMNVVARRDQANAAVVRLGAGGALTTRSDSATTALVVDVFGYFRR